MTEHLSESELIRRARAQSDDPNSRACTPACPVGEHEHEKPLTAQLADALERRADQARDAHDALTWMAVELGWATDGTLPTAVRHAREVLRLRTTERDAARESAGILGDLSRDLSAEAQESAALLDGAAGTALPPRERLEAVTKALVDAWRHMHTNESHGYQRMLARVAIAEADRTAGRTLASGAPTTVSNLPQLITALGSEVLDPHGLGFESAAVLVGEKVYLAFLTEQGEWSICDGGHDIAPGDEQTGAAPSVDELGLNGIAPLIVRHGARILWPLPAKASGTADTPDIDSTYEETRTTPMTAATPAS